MKLPKQPRVSKSGELIFVQKKGSNDIVNAASFGDELFGFIHATGLNAENNASELLDTLGVSYRVLIKKRFYNEAREHLLKQLSGVLVKAGSRLASDIPSDVALVTLAWRVMWMRWSPYFTLFVFRNKNLEKLTPDAHNGTHVPLVDVTHCVVVTTNVLERTSETIIRKNLEQILTSNYSEEVLESILNEITGGTNEQSFGLGVIKLL
ncbi:hypothetical protein C4579_00200 [Candidatus Microgenomates bacterium]|nr:MAG: hypothetical protein C4579_00200 [Candidatus Microgenomates bacterium]